MVVQLVMVHRDPILFADFVLPAEQVLGLEEVLKHLFDAVRALVYGWRHYESGLVTLKEVKAASRRELSLEPSLVHRLSIMQAHWLQVDNDIENDTEEGKGAK